MSFDLTTLGDYATVQGGFAYKSQDFVGEPGIAVLKIKNVRHGFIDYATPSYVSEDTARSTAKWFTVPGDILISMTGSGPSAPESLVGRVARVWKQEPSALINQRVGRLRLKNLCEIDPDFLFYLLSQTETQEFLVTNSTGSANQVNISSKTIEAVPCPRIGFIESKEVAAFLNTFEQRIRLLRETNATLEAIAQALFKSWFVDFDPVRAKMEGRAPEGMDEATAALFPDRLEESALGLVPRGWRVGTLGDIAQTVRQQLQPSELHIGLHYVGLEHIPRKSLNLANWGTADGLESAKAAFRDGDILFGKLRPYFHKVVVAPFDGVCSTDILVCQAKKSAYYGFALMQLSSTALIHYADRLSNGAKMPRVSWKDLAAYPTVIPPEPVSAEYKLVLDPLMARMKSNMHEAQTLAALRDTLLPRLISGQLRLPEAEALLEEAFS